MKENKTVNQIVSNLQFFIIKTINLIAGKTHNIISSDDKADLLQLISLIILTYPEEKIIRLDATGELKPFVTNIIKHQLCSATSDFYRQNRRPKKNNIPIEKIPEEPYVENY